MRPIVAALYVLGFALILTGAGGAWRHARQRHQLLVDLAEEVRVDYDNYQAASETLFADQYRMSVSDGPEAAARVAEVEAARSQIKDRNSQRLAAAGIHPAGSPSQDTWIPIELQMELTLLTGARQSLGKAGLTALAGGLISTVASVWSLYL